MIKWIGQHIWDFISRFRNDVYLEKLGDAGEDTDKFLVAKSDGQVAYRTGAEVLNDIGGSGGGATTFTLTADSGSDQTIADGNTLDIAGGGAISTVVGATDTVTINHNDTSAQSSVDNSGRTYIQDVTLDAYGHVTGLASATETVTDTTYSEATSSDAGLMSTAHHDKLDGIAAGAEVNVNADWNSSSGDSEILNKPTVIAFDGNTANGILTYKDADEATVESNAIYDGNDLTLTSSTADKPVLSLTSTNTASDSNASLKFIKDAANVADGEFLGEILFIGDNDALGTPEQIDYARIWSRIADMTDGSEEGTLYLGVASHDGEMNPGVSIASGNLEDEVDVTVGNGASSLVTVPGKLSIGARIDFDGAGITGIQIAAESFSDDDVSLMTSAAIEDKILSYGYSTTTGTVDTSGTPINNDFAKFTDANTIEGRSYTETKQDLSLDNVENTALSTWAGSANLTTTGALNSGSITSGFGNIDTGSSTIDTTGAVSTGEITSTSIRHSISGNNAGDYGPGAEIIYGIGTDSVSAGVIYCLKDNSSGWEPVDADIESITVGLLAVATSVAGSTNSGSGMIIKGCVTLAGAYTAGTDDLGAIVYASLQPGEATLTKPTAAGDWVRILGYSLNVSDRKMFFNPDSTYIELT